MPDQDISKLLSDRIKSLENRFENRFDRLEARLNQWMEKNGDQNVCIQRNTDMIDSLHKRFEGRSRKILAISIGIASCVATLLSAFIQILFRYVSRN